MRAVVLLISCLAAVSAAPPAPQRIMGGELTTIDQYPTISAVLFIFQGDFRHGCGSTILNQRSVLTAAHCFDGGVAAHQTRVRVGSTFANSGGTVHVINRIILHPAWGAVSIDSDIAIMQTSATIVYSNVVQPAFIAGPDYYPADNAPVWAAGWGATSFMGPWSEQLRHVQIYVVNQEICNERFGGDVTANMLCSGVLDVGGRDQCTGDSGGPLYHFFDPLNDYVLVGVCSFGFECGSPRWPGINIRVSRFSNWIRDNA